MPAQSKCLKVPISLNQQAILHQAALKIFKKLLHIIRTQPRPLPSFLELLLDFQVSVEVLFAENLFI